MDTSELLEFEWLDQDLFGESYYDFNFENGDRQLDELILEARDGLTEQNAVQKIWTFIKKIMKWIVNKVAKMIQWIRQKLSSKRKSISTIINQLGINPTNKKTKSISNPTDIKQMTHDIKVRLDRDSKSLIFDLTDVQEASLKQQADFSAKRRNNDQVLNPKYTITAIAAIRNPDWSAKIVNIVDALVNGNSKSSQSQALSANSELMLIASKYYNSRDTSISLEDIFDFQKIVGDIYSKLNDLDSIQGDVRAINTLSTTLAMIQIGINSMTALMNSQEYTLCDSYIDSIDDFETLAKFSKLCIESFIPAKVMMYNMYIVSSDKLTGGKSSRDPKWGQTRLIFIPEKNKDVYKIAINKLGIISNRNEIKITNLLQGTEEINLITAVTGSIDNGTIITTEYVTPKTIDDMTSRKIASMLNKKLRNRSIEIVDAHIENFGVSGGRTILYDYGAIQHYLFVKRT